MYAEEVCFQLLPLLKRPARDAQSGRKVILFYSLSLEAAKIGLFLSLL